MANRSKAKGTWGETKILTNCLVRVWPKMERTGSKVAYGQMPDFDDKAERCPWAIEAKTVEQQRMPEWWAQTLRSAALVGRLPLLIWNRKGFPRDPWVINTWTSFEPVAAFIDEHLEEFNAFVASRAEADRTVGSEPQI